MLMMSGDQIYADHVAGPTLDAIQQVIQLLGLIGEELPTDSQVNQINSSDALFESEYHLLSTPSPIATPQHFGFSAR